MEHNESGKFAELRLEPPILGKFAELCLSEHEDDDDTLVAPPPVPSAQITRNNKLSLELRYQTLESKAGSKFRGTEKFPLFEGKYRQLICYRFNMGENTPQLALELERFLEQIYYESTLYVAHMYNRGLGVKEDISKAQEFFSQAYDKLGKLVFSDQDASNNLQYLAYKVTTDLEIYQRAVNHCVQTSNYQEAFQLFGELAQEASVMWPLNSTQPDHSGTTAPVLSPPPRYAPRF